MGEGKMNRKNFFFTLLAFSLMATLGCAGATDSGSTHAPSISNLSYSPQTVSVGSSAGYATVSMSMDFADSGGDISALSLVAYNNGTQVLNQPQQLLLTGYASGRVSFNVSGVPTMAAASYDFQIFVTDAAGASSNTLAGTFTVN